MTASNGDFCELHRRPRSECDGPVCTMPDHPPMISGNYLRHEEDLSDYVPVRPPKSSGLHDHAPRPVSFYCSFDGEDWPCTAVREGA